LPTIRGFFLRLLCAAAAFAVAEGVVFRTGLYSRLLEPDSTAGLLQSVLDDEKRRVVAGPREVLAIGDSRMGMRARAANELEPETGYRFATIAMPGSTPRVWYYMLRDVDPTGRRYAAILIGVDEYDDEDYADLSNREMDIRYVTPLLGWADVFPFAASFPEWRTRWEAARAAVFKGYAYRADVQDFLAHHKFRMKKIAVMRREAAAWRYNQAWDAGDVTGLSVDWKNWTIHFPEGSTESQKRILTEVLMRETVEQTGLRGKYLRQWYGRIVEHYRGSRTKIVFLRLPRGPVVRPILVARKTAVARELAASNSQVRLIGEHAFDSLEQPRFFGDPMHLNQAGSQEFSRMAAREIGRVLGR
jgi:8-oxo-dGTP pyrophosphatase MutT (NUDIX family)